VQFSRGFFLLIACGLWLAMSGLALGQSPRQRQLIDSDWRFSLDGPGSERFPEAGFDDSKWRKVQLPHDYVVEGGFLRGGDSSHGFRPKPVGWYRRVISPLPGAGRHCWLEFDGIYRDSTIWLNGQKIGGHQSGYTSFYFDITRYLKPDKANIVAVRVDPSQNEGWWYEGGGIYRHVWLTSLSPVHVAHWGTFVKTPTVTQDEAEIVSDTLMNNDGDRPAELTVESTVVSGHTVVASSTAQVVAAPGQTAVAQRFKVPNPRLWSVGSPNRYVLRTVLRQGTNEWDRTETAFGIRAISFDPDKGFFLNGKHVELKGTANHQDFAGVGVAVTDNLERLRVQELKNMGCNAFRCAHNPPTPELLDACDELGMLVIDENRHPGDNFESKTGPNTPYQDMSEVDSMVLRDRNHPCVIAWSLCNEEWSLQTNAAGVRMLSAVNKRVKKLDPTRPTTLAMGGGAWNADSPDLRDVVDVTGANYGADAYDSYHRRFPEKPLAATEFSAQPNMRGVYENDPASGKISSLPVQILGGDFSWMTPQDVAWSAIASRPFVAGGFAWSGFDYRGEPTPYKWPYAWPDVIGSYGQMDLCGFPKDAYYYFRSVWSSDAGPILHLFPHWNWAGQEGKPRPVYVYTNADEVELLLNGRVVGAREPVKKDMHAEWTVPYAPGLLEVRGFRDGKPFGADKVETTGTAVSTIVSPEFPKATANPEELMAVQVSLRDARGRFVQTADNALTFSVSGPASIVGAGNGDPSDHEPENTASLTTTRFSYHAFNGRALVILRPTGQTGQVVLTVTSPGLKPTRIVIPVAPAR
jgi:beta-galactosidase